MTLLDLNHATIENRHLSNLIEDLPTDCFFNKVLCGAGGTHLALVNPNPYVILVPTTDLIISKREKTYPTEVMYVFGNVTVATITEYLNSGGNKIMSTYHSLPKVLEAFSNSVKDTEEFQLLVDEAHMLTEGDDKDFMHNEINYILQSYTKFKTYCFMTATPFPLECFPEQIKDVEYVTAEWNPEVIEVTTVKAQQITSKFIDYVTKIALDHIDGTKEGNAYFFYNSVEAISQVCYKLLKAGLCSVSDIRIIAADKNSSYIHKYVSTELNIESVVSSPKKLNFLTAKAFEGCDIYDEDGVTYVCADARKKHTRLEIHTKIPQIVNRIRNSKYNNEVYLLYTKSFISTNVSKEEFIIQTEAAISKANRQVDSIKNMDSETKELLDTNFLETSEYFTKDVDGSIIANPNAGKRALALWESANQTYSVFKTANSLESTEVCSPLIELMFNGGNTTEFQLPSGAEKIKLGGKAANFTTVCKEYLEALETRNKEQIEFIEGYDDIFRLARLTFKGSIHSDFSASSYRRSNIEKRLDIQIGCNSIKLVSNIHNTFKVGETVAKEKIKEKLDDLYQAEGISKKAKATDLKEYFEVKNTTCRIKGSCFRIISKL